MLLLSDCKNNSISASRKTIFDELPDFFDEFPKCDDKCMEKTGEIARRTVLAATEVCVALISIL